MRHDHSFLKSPNVNKMKKPTLPAETKSARLTVLGLALNGVEWEIRNEWECQFRNLFDHFSAVLQLRKENLKGTEEKSEGMIGQEELSVFLDMVSFVHWNTGTVGLWQPSVHSNVAFWPFDLGSCKPCEQKKSVLSWVAFLFSFSIISPLSLSRSRTAKLSKFLFRILWSATPDVWPELQWLRSSFFPGPKW